MNKSRLFEIWAPPASVWSAWAKPVLFAHTTSRLLAFCGYDPPREAATAPDVGWAPPADGTSAIVVDLAGATGVWLGVALAEAGFRPVPLDNACPAPTDRLP